MLKHRYLLLILLGISNYSHAFSWDDLWLNPNQQGKQLLDANKAKDAANKFQHPQWKGAAYYKSQQYEQAYQQFQQDKSATGYYNQGNALAYLQKYDEAITAYEESLKKDPKNSDAQHNIEVLKKLKQNQSQDQKDNQQQDKKNNQQDNKQDKQQNQKDQQQKDSKQQDSQQQNNKPQDNKSQENQNHKQNGQDKQNPANNNQIKPTNSPDKQAQQANQPQQKSTDKNKPDNAAANLTPQQLRQQQEMKAALSQIPDDPGGLLRNKFIRDYQQEQQGNNQ